MKDKRSAKRRITPRFFINIGLFVLIVGLGLIFKDEYVALRNSFRGKVAGVVEYIVDGIQTKDLHLQMPSLSDISYGADNAPLTGEGVPVNESDTQSPTNTGDEYRFPADQYPYRAMLNTDAQAVYNQVYSNALKGNDKQFTLIHRATQDVLHTIMSAVYNDHPELFWVDTAYSFGYLKNGDAITLTLSFNDTAKNLAKSQAEFDAVVNHIIQGAAQYGNNVDKEKYVHDYLMDHVIYDESAQMHQSAYSALVLGKSVCAGYSRAFQHILLEIGIPCYYATGTAAGGSHAWNIVSINGDYYNVDTSWDDATGVAYGTLCYTYFNVSDASFSTDHTRDEMSARLPVCTGTAMTYNKVYGKTEDVVSTSDKYTTYESLGYTKSAVIDSMSAYNRYCQQHLIRLGAGEHVLTMVIQNADLLKKIYSAAENGSYIDDYAQAVVNALSLKNCDISLKMRGETLTDGYILLTQTVIITSEPIVPTATPMPTAKPTPTSTAIPTIVPTVIPTSPPTVEPTITPDPGVFTPSIQDGIPTPAIS